MRVRPIPGTTSTRWTHPFHRVAGRRAPKGRRAVCASAVRASRGCRRGCGGAGGAVPSARRGRYGVARRAYRHRRGRWGPHLAASAPLSGRVLRPCRPPRWRARRGQRGAARSGGRSYRRRIGPPVRGAVPALSCVPSVFPPLRGARAVRRRLSVTDGLRATVLVFCHRTVDTELTLHQVRVASITSTHRLVVHHRLSGPSGGRMRSGGVYRPRTARVAPQVPGLTRMPPKRRLRRFGPSARVTGVDLLRGPSVHRGPDVHRSPDVYSGLSEVGGSSGRRVSAGSSIQEIPKPQRPRPARVSRTSRTSQAPGEVQLTWSP